MGDLSRDALEILYADFITAHHSSLRLGECQEFRALLRYLNSETDAWLPALHNTTKAWLMRQINEQKIRAQQVLENTLSDIHISTH